MNYNPSCTAKDLQAIMADHYENIEESIPPLDFPPLRKLKSAQSDEKQEFSRSSSKGPERLDVKDLFRMLFVNQYDIECQNENG